MSNDRRSTVVLCGLTGFGNTVLKALLDDPRVSVAAVFTTSYAGPFPYYDEEQLLALCRRRGVTCHCDVRVSGEHGVRLIRDYAPDAILVATFKQMLRQDVLTLPRIGIINFHPSLLPKYRGPSPTHAALLHDDDTSGVSVHWLTERMDEGNILCQRSVRIDDVSNDGALRKRLAALAGEMVPGVLDVLLGETRPTGVPQDPALATYAPRPTEEDGHLETGPDVESVRRKIRALNPLPGTSVLIGSRRVPVDRCERSSRRGPDGVEEHDDAIDIVMKGEAIRLFKTGVVAQQGRASTGVMEIESGTARRPS